MIEKDIIKRIVREFHISGVKNRLFSRNIKIPLDSDKIITVTGPRRSGKTSILLNCIAELINKGFERERIIYINFEDERLNLNVNNLEFIIESYRELYPDIPMDKCCIFFDEIQNIEGWEKFVRRVYDNFSRNIFITGSNSKLLSSEIATSLRGRTVKYEVLPLSFEEFLVFKSFSFDKNKDFFSQTKKVRLINLLKEYLTYGGFPEIPFLDEEIKRKTLWEYFEVMIYRDIVERYKITNLSALKFFFKRIAESDGKFFSVNKIYNELKSLGIEIGKNALYDYLDYAESSYLLKLLKKHYRAVKRTELSEKKVYFIDSGLLNSIRYFSEKDYGILLENLIFNEISKKYSEVFCFKENKECDFVAGKKAIQVCYDISDEITFSRERAGIKEACKYLGIKDSLIITFDDKKKFKEGNVNVEVIPASEFLLNMGYFIG